jgi:predicted nucleic acid-binding Zn finger protein
MTIVSSSGHQYDIDLSKNYCTCPSWRFKRVAAADRSCKHLDQVRAEVRRAGVRSAR